MTKELPRGTGSRGRSGNNSRIHFTSVSMTNVTRNSLTLGRTNREKNKVPFPLRHPSLHGDGNGPARSGRRGGNGTTVGESTLARTSTFISFQQDATTPPRFTLRPRLRQFRRSVFPSPLSALVPPRSIHVHDHDKSAPMNIIRRLCTPYMLLA